MADSVKELIQQMAGEKTSVVQGVVSSVNPIRITLVNDSVMDIPSNLLIVPEYLTKRTKTVTIVSMTGSTENGGSGNTGDGGSGNTQSGGGGNTNSGGGGYTGYGGDGQTGVCTIGGADHFHYLGSHNHSIDSHTHGIDSHTHGLNNHKHSLPEHKHNISLTNTSVQIQIDDSLSVGEYVHLLSIGQGKIYYVLGRV